MTLEELKEYYGTYTEMCHELRFGMNVYQYWKKIGYIPYPTQLLIQDKTDCLFKASKDHIKLN